jgi:Flp pilus assembly protein TadD
MFQLLRRAALVGLVCVFALHAEAEVNPVIVELLKTRVPASAEVFDRLEDGEERDVAEAARLADAAVQADEQSADAYLVRSIVYQQSRQWAKAKADIQKAFDLASTDPFVISMQVESLANGFDFDAAETLVEKAIKQHPESYRLLIAKAVLKMKQRQPWEMSKLLEQAADVAKTDQEIIEANFTRAAMFTAGDRKINSIDLAKGLKHLDRAEASATKVLEAEEALDPRYPTLRGYLLELGGKLSEAADVYADVLKDPRVEANERLRKDLQDRLTACRKAIADAEAKAAAAAEKRADDLRQRFLKNPDAPLEIRMPATAEALAKWRMGQLEEALALANQLVEDHPEQVEPYVTRSIIHRSIFDATYTRESRDAAMQDAETAYAMKPGDPLVAAHMVRAYAVKGAFEKAEASLDAIKGRLPRSLLVRIAEVDVMSIHHKYNAALQALAELEEEFKAESLKPLASEPIAEAQYRLGSRLIKSGGYAKALPVIQRSLRFDDARDADKAFALAELYVAIGREADALQTLLKLKTRDRIGERPELLAQAEARVPEIQAMLALREKQSEEAEATAQAFVAVIEKYQRNPQSDVARQAVLDLIGPYYQQRLAQVDVLPLVPIDLEAMGPRDTRPEDIKDASTRADAVLYGRGGASALFTTVGGEVFQRANEATLDIFPAFLSLYMKAIECFEAKDYQAAYENALLAEATRFATMYHDDKAGSAGEYAMYLQPRALARIAFFIQPNEHRLNPMQRALHQMTLLQANGDWFTADRRRAFLEEVLTLKDRFQWEMLIERAWKIPDRRALTESQYYTKWNEANTRQNARELDRIAARMHDKWVEHERFGYELLGYFESQDDERRRNNLVSQISSRDPYNIYVHYHEASRSVRAKDASRAILHFNTVVQFSKQAGSPKAYAYFERDAARYLREPQGEPSLKPNVYQGYWDLAMAYEKQMTPKGTKGLPELWRSACEAAGLRVLELAPNNPQVMDRVALYRLYLGNYQGCIEAAEKTIAMNPDYTGLANLRIGGAYGEMLPFGTNDTETLHANYRKSIAAYRTAIKEGVGNEAAVRSLIAQMYDRMKMFKEAVDEYLYVAEHHTSAVQRARSFYLAAANAERADLLDQARLAELYENSADLYESLDKSQLDLTDRSNRVAARTKAIKLKQQR